VGISEQARNITDPSLKLVIEHADEPAGALKQHLLRLEASLRDVLAARDLIAGQCAWLAQNIDRNLKLAESADADAERFLKLDRETDARRALQDKRSTLLQVTTDQKKLRTLELSLTPLDAQLTQLRERIEQARAIRPRLSSGKPLTDAELHRHASEEPPPTPTPDTTSETPTASHDQDIERELDRLRQRLDKASPEDRA